MPTARKDSVVTAEAAMTAAYPDLRERLFALEQLLDSAALNLAANPDEFEGSEDCEFVEVNYAARPGSTRYNGLPSDFEQITEDLQKPHCAFIDACAHTRSGKPLSGSVNLRFHNPGLIAYARSFVADCSKAPEATASHLEPDDLRVSEELLEGRLIPVLANAFERSARARSKCIEHYGCICTACGFDFAARYGTTGAGYIQVHHVTPLSKIGREYVVDPVRDLVPLCANCHAVAHLRDPACSPEELEAMLATSLAQPKDA